MEALTCHLIFLSSERFGDAFEFTSARITLGRSPSADITFDQFSDLTVAPHHAEILTDGETFYLFNLSTRAGTFVNGNAVEERCELRHNDVIQLGEKGPELLFRLGPLPEDPLEDLPRLIPQAELKFLSGANAGDVFYIRGDRPTRIGRRADMEIALHPSANIEVSGHHCTIIHDGQQFCVVDTSRNGTYINGLKVDPQAPLEDGAKLQLAPGGPIAEFHVLPSVRQYHHKEVPSSERADLIPHRPEPGGESAGTSEKVPITPDKGQSPTSTQSSYVANSQSTLSNSRRNSPSWRASKESKPSLPRRKRIRLVLVFCSLIVLLLALVGAVRYVRATAGFNSSSRAEYLAQIERGTMTTNEHVGYSVLVPRGWTKLEKDEILSIESPDKVIGVDYVASDVLQEGLVQEILRARGAVPTHLGETSTRSGTVTTFFGRGGNKAWLAALHRFSGGQIPLLALMEVDLDRFGSIPDDVFKALAFEKLSPPAKTLDVGVAAALTRIDSVPTTDSAQKGTAEVAAITTLPLTEAKTAPRTTPKTAVRHPEEMAEEALTTCARARLVLRLAPGWSAKVDETSGLLFAVSPHGLEIRIARDESPLNPETVFAQMQQDGWAPIRVDVQGIPIKPNISLSEAVMQQPPLYAYLGLEEDIDSSTLVIYVEKDKVFSEEELAEIRECVRRLISLPSPLP